MGSLHSLTARPLKRALVIDDDDSFRAVGALYLKELGWDVDLAADGRIGWRMAQRVAYRLILCDIVMPHQDGFETMRLLRTLEPRPFIVAISGGGLMAFDSYLNMALKLGADRVLAKPFALADLAKAVDREAEKSETEEIVNT